MRDYSVRVWVEPDDYEDAADLEAERAKFPSVPISADSPGAAAILYADAELDIRLNDDDDMLCERVEIRLAGDPDGERFLFTVSVEKHWVAERNEEY